jgi:hypothetical protein
VLVAGDSITYVFGDIAENIVIKDVGNIFIIHIILHTMKMIRGDYGGFMRHIRTWTMSILSLTHVSGEPRDLMKRFISNRSQREIL